MLGRLYGFRITPPEWQVGSRATQSAEQYRWAHGLSITKAPVLVTRRLRIRPSAFRTIGTTTDAPCVSIAGTLRNEMIAPLGPCAESLETPRAPRWPPTLATY
jgi:hypothetical protein